MVFINSELGEFLVELLDLFVDLLVDSLFFSLKFDFLDLSELFFERSFSCFGVFSWGNDYLILGAFVLFFLYRFLFSRFFGEEVCFLLLVVVSAAHSHAGRFFRGVFFFLFLDEMLVNVFFGDVEFGFEQLNVLIDGEKDVFVFYFEFFVDFSESGVDLFEIVDHGFFSESETVKPAVELLFFEEKVLVMEEQVFFLSAHIEPFVFGDCVIVG